MAAFDYPALASEVMALTLEMGGVVTLEIQPETIEPLEDAKPWRQSVSVPSSLPVTAVMFEYADKLVDGQLVLRGDMQALFAPEELSGAAVTRITALTDGNGRRWRVIKAGELAPAGISVLVSLQLRS